MKLRIAALIFGILFLGAGVAWHLPFLFSDNLLFGVLEIDSMHNKFHIASGLVGLVATSSTGLARAYFKLLGFVYLLLGIAGFFFETQFLAMEVNMADNIFHTVIGLVALLIGYKMRVPAEE